MKHTLLSLCFLLITWASIAQISYEKRIEFPLEDGCALDNITELDNKGFILSALKLNLEANLIQWTYHLYNTDLELVKSKNVSLNPKFIGKNYKYIDNQNIHTLYYHYDGDYSIITLDATTLAETRIEGKLPKKTLVSKIIVSGDYAFIQGSIKSEHVIFSVNWKTGKEITIPITIPKVSAKKITLNNFQSIPNTNDVFVFIDVNIKNKNHDFYAIRLNEKGERKEMFTLTKDTDRIIVNITVSILENGKYVFTGTYSKHQNKFTDLLKGNFDNVRFYTTEPSHGIYLCQAQKGKVDFIKFLNFLDLKDLPTSLPENYQERVKQSKLANNDKEVTIAFQIVPHKISQVEGGYLFIGEAYYDTYSNELHPGTSYESGSQGQSLQNYKMFDGHQYTHALIAKFTTEGELVWDKVFTMKTLVKPRSLSKFISVQEQSTSNTKLAFTNQGKVVSAQIGFNGEVLKNFESTKIKMTHGNKTKLSASNLTYWYDNYFLAYGYQEIKIKKNKTRKVYFVSKVKCE